MISLSQPQLDCVRSILNHHCPRTTRIFVFGSRATATPKPYSDLDLAIDAGTRLSLSTLGDLKEAFSESDLPFRVDVVDLTRIGSRFHTIIEKTMVEIPR